MNIRNVIDLTLPFSEGMRGYSKEIYKTLDNDGWNASMLHLYSHAGTHMDAPVHFGVSDKSIDETPLGDCIVECYIARAPDVTPRALLKPKGLTIAPKEALYGKGVLIHTGWGQYAHNLQKYRNELPRISEELAQYLIDAGVKLIGVEPPSIADVNNREELTKIHRMLLEQDIIIVEGLTNLDKISGDWFTFAVFPLKITNGDGSPVRALAMET